MIVVGVIVVGVIVVGVIVVGVIVVGVIVVGVIVVGVIVVGVIVVGVIVVGVIVVGVIVVGVIVVGVIVVGVIVVGVIVVGVIVVTVIVVGVIVVTVIVVTVIVVTVIVVTVIVVTVIVVTVIVVVPMARESFRLPFFLRQLTPSSINQDAQPKRLLAILRVPTSSVFLEILSQCFARLPNGSPLLFGHACVCGKFGSPGDKVGQLGGGGALIRVEFLQPLTDFDRRITKTARPVLRRLVTMVKQRCLFWIAGTTGQEQATQQRGR